MGFIGRIKEEFQVIQERDPAIKSPLEVLLYPSFRVMIQYRRAHKLYEKGHYFLARWISEGPTSCMKRVTISWPGGFPREQPERQVLKFIQGQK